MLKFLHTSDWQLGMTRSFLDAGVSERYTHDRLQAVRNIAQIAQNENCAFILVAGDVFESNMVSPKTILRSLAAMATTQLPLYLLPANHDPLNETSVFNNKTFINNKPKNVTVLTNNTPVPVAENAEIVAAPWHAKRQNENPLHPLIKQLQPTETHLRIIAAHGEVDALAPMSSATDLISLEAMKNALAQNKAHYFALGDKHSPANLDPEGRIHYPGTPEATAFREPNPGFATVVELTKNSVHIKNVRTGAWTFTELEKELLSPDDAQLFLADLDRIADKERHALRIRLAGRLGLADTVRVRKRLEEFTQLFASLECDQSALHVGLDPQDIEDNRLTGFAAAAATRLKTMMEKDDKNAAARDALMLLTMINDKED